MEWSPLMQRETIDIVEKKQRSLALCEANEKR